MWLVSLFASFSRCRVLVCSDPLVAEGKSEHTFAKKHVLFLQNELPCLFVINT